VSKNFQFYVPVDIYKDKKNNYRIKGLASTGDKDLQGEIIKQQGLDISVLKSGKGYLNWEHKNDPKNIIGLIDDAEITEKGLMVDGQLFKKHDQAKAVHQILDSLDDNRKHRIQMSVEGTVISKSDGKEKGSGKVIDKARITAVALTMNPVNKSTYAELVKSLTAVEGSDLGHGDEFPSSFSSPDPSIDEKDIDDTKDKEEIIGDKEEGVTKNFTDKVKEGVEEKVENQKVTVAVDYICKKAEEKGLDPMVVLDGFSDKLIEDAEGQEKFDKFIKSLESNPFALDIIKVMVQEGYIRKGGKGSGKRGHKTYNSNASKRHGGANLKDPERVKEETAYAKKEASRKEAQKRHMDKLIERKKKEGKPTKGVEDAKKEGKKPEPAEMQDDDAEARAREHYNAAWDDLSSSEQDFIQAEYDKEQVDGGKKKKEGKPTKGVEDAKKEHVKDKGKRKKSLPNIKSLLKAIPKEKHKQFLILLKANIEKGGKGSGKKGHRTAKKPRQDKSQKKNPKEYKGDIIKEIGTLSRKMGADAEFDSAESSDNELRLDFNSSRHGGFFTPRAGEQDDDSPKFTGIDKIGSAVQKIVGKDFNVKLRDYEKGMFTIRVVRKGK